MFRASNQEYSSEIVTTTFGDFVSMVDANDLASGRTYRFLYQMRYRHYTGTIDSVDQYTFEEGNFEWLQVTANSSNTYKNAVKSEEFPLDEILWTHHNDLLTNDAIAGDEITSPTHGIIYSRYCPITDTFFDFDWRSTAYKNTFWEYSLGEGIYLDQADRETGMGSITLPLFMPGAFVAEVRVKQHRDNSPPFDSINQYTPFASMYIPRIAFNVKQVYKYSQDWGTELIVIHGTNGDHGAINMMIGCCSQVRAHNSALNGRFDRIHSGCNLDHEFICDGPEYAGVYRCSFENNVKLFGTMEDCTVLHSSDLDEYRIGGDPRKTEFAGDIVSRGVTQSGVNIVSDACFYDDANWAGAGGAIDSSRGKISFIDEAEQISTVNGVDDAPIIGKKVRMTIYCDSYTSGYCTVYYGGALAGIINGKGSYEFDVIPVNTSRLIFSNNSLIGSLRWLSIRDVYYLGDNEQPIDLSYTELVSLYDSDELVNGQKYRFTYRTRNQLNQRWVEDHWVTDEIHTGEDEIIIVEAVDGYIPGPRVPGPNILTDSGFDDPAKWLLELYGDATGAISASQFAYNQGTGTVYLNVQEANYIADRRIYPGLIEISMNIIDDGAGSLAFTYFDSVNTVPVSETGTGIYTFQVSSSGMTGYNPYFQLTGSGIIDDLTITFLEGAEGVPIAKTIISPDATSETHSTDRIKYSLFNDWWKNDSASDRGVIYFRENDIEVITTEWDYRNIKFRIFESNPGSGIYDSFEDAFEVGLAYKDVHTFDFDYNIAQVKLSVHRNDDHWLFGTYYSKWELPRVVFQKDAYKVETRWGNEVILACENNTNVHIGCCSVTYLRGHVNGLTIGQGLSVNAFGSLENTNIQRDVTINGNLINCSVLQSYAGGDISSGTHENKIFGLERHSQWEFVEEIDMSNGGAQDLTDILIPNLSGDYMIEISDHTSESGGINGSLTSSTPVELFADPLITVPANWEADGGVISVGSFSGTNPEFTFQEDTQSILGHLSSSFELSWVRSDTNAAVSVTPKFGAVAGTPEPGGTAGQRFTQILTCLADGVWPSLEVVGTGAFEITEFSCRPALTSHDSYGVIKYTDGNQPEIGSGISISVSNDFDKGQFIRFYLYNMGNPNKNPFVVSEGAIGSRALPRTLGVFESSTYSGADFMSKMVFTFPGLDQLLIYDDTYGFGTVFYTGTIRIFKKVN